MVDYIIDYISILRRIGKFLFSNIIETENLIIKYLDMFRISMDMFRIPMMDEYLIYYLLGWYITTVSLNRKQRYCIYTLGIIGIMITVLGAQLFTTENCVAYNTFYSNSSINVLMYSGAVFVLVFYTVKDGESKKNKIISLLAKLSFGVYLIHPLILKAVLKLIWFENPVANIGATYIATLAISFVAVWAMSKLPIIKKLVRG